MGALVKGPVLTWAWGSQRRAGTGSGVAVLLPPAVPAGDLSWALDGPERSGATFPLPGFWKAEASRRALAVAGVGPRAHLQKGLPLQACPGHRFVPVAPSACEVSQMSGGQEPSPSQEDADRRGVGGGGLASLSQPEAPGRPSVCLRWTECGLGRADPALSDCSPGLVGTPGWDSGWGGGLRHSGAARSCGGPAWGAVLCGAGPVAAPPESSAHSSARGSGLRGSCAGDGDGSAWVAFPGAGSGVCRSFSGSAGCKGPKPQSQERPLWWDF